MRVVGARDGVSIFDERADFHFVQAAGRDFEGDVLVDGINSVEVERGEEGVDEKMLRVWAENYITTGSSISAKTQTERS